MLSGEKLGLINSKSLETVFAFSIGGGSFHEYESFKLLIEQVDLPVEERDSTLSSSHIIYGCDYIFQPKEFLHEILKLN